MMDLERDPAYQARIAAKEEARLARVARNRGDAAPLLADLRGAGFKVDSVRDLLTKNLDYRDAIPLLLAWLPRIANTAVKESIVRTVSVPFARPMASRPLIEEFRRADESASPLRWAIGNALDIVADDSVADEMLELAKDRRYGTSREMVVMGLANLSDSRAISVLVAYSGQPGQRIRLHPSTRSGPPGRDRSVATGSLGGGLVVPDGSARGTLG